VALLLQFEANIAASFYKKWHTEMVGRGYVEAFVNYRTRFFVKNELDWIPLEQTGLSKISFFYLPQAYTRV
jgi:hypothetical protein